MSFLWFKSLPWPSFIISGTSTQPWRSSGSCTGCLWSHLALLLLPLFISRHSGPVPVLWARVWICSCLRALVRAVPLPEMLFLIWRASSLASGPCPNNYQRCLSWSLCLKYLYPPNSPFWLSFLFSIYIIDTSNKHLLPLPTFPYQNVNPKGAKALFYALLTPLCRHRRSSGNIHWWTVDCIRASTQLSVLSFVGSAKG